MSRSRRVDPIVRQIRRVTSPADPTPGALWKTGARGLDLRIGCFSAQQTKDELLGRQWVLRIERGALSARLQERSWWCELDSKKKRALGSILERRD